MQRIFHNIFSNSLAHNVFKQTPVFVFNIAFVSVEKGAISSFRNHVEDCYAPYMLYLAECFSKFTFRRISNVNVNVNVSSWLIANKLSPNVSKSNFIIFNSMKKKIDHSFNIKILNNSLEEKNSTKYLGVIIDKHLNWASHIHYTKQNISKGIGMIAKLRHYVPLTNLKQTYSAFIVTY